MEHTREEGHRIAATYNCSMYLWQLLIGAVASFSFAKDHFLIMAFNISPDNLEVAWLHYRADKGSSALSETSFKPETQEMAQL